VRTLTAIAREMLGAGVRILTGALLAIFFLAYALGALLLLPLVALALAMVALPGRLRAAAPQVRAAGSRLGRAMLTMVTHARAALGGLLSLDR
jgi:hypothetical protein